MAIKRRLSRLIKKGLGIFPIQDVCIKNKGFYFTQQRYDGVVKYLEADVVADPMYPSNYYKLTMFYFDSTEKVRGMIYG